MTDIQYFELEQAEYAKIQAYITKVMRDTSPYTECHTIEKSNDIWNKTLIRAKTNAYAALDIRVRQDVIDRVDEYWRI